MTDKRNGPAANEAASDRLVNESTHTSLAASADTLLEAVKDGRLAIEG